MITKKYYKLIRVSYEDMNYLTLTNTSDSIGLFSVSKQGSPSTTNLEYSLNGADWVTYDLTELPSVEVPADGHIYLRGTNESGFNRGINNYYTLAMTTNFTASGNPFSLRNTDPSTFSTYTSVLESEFSHLFYNSNITDASGLITSQITSIVTNSCYLMFRDCSTLTAAPDLSNVTSIGSSGCFSMFYNCSTLTAAPDLSNVTSIGSNGCNYMFFDCSTLSEVTAPNISAWETSKTQSWLGNAGKSATGTKTFYAPTGLEIPTNDNSGIPSGWTRVDY